MNRSPNSRVEAVGKVHGKTFVRKEPSPMSAEVFSKRIDALYDYLGDDPRWNGSGQMFSFLSGKHETMVSKWRNGNRAVPAYVWRFLNAIAALAEIGGRPAVLYAIMDNGLLEEAEGGTRRVMDYQIPEHHDVRLRA